MTVVLVPNRSVPPAPGAAELADAVVDSLAELDPDGVLSHAAGQAGRAGRAGRAEPPTPPLHPRRATVRYWLARVVVTILVRSYVRVRIDGIARLPGGPAVYCFNHLNWADPFILGAALPYRPRLYFFGPSEEDMAVGGRNRIMGWTGAAVPYKPGKNDLLDVTRRVRAVFRAGGVLAIAGEGRIHAGESELLPLNDGPAYFALRSRVPLVPIAINGTSWLRLGRRIRVRVGEPIVADGRATREAVATLTERAWEALHGLVADQPDFPPPGRFGRWLTELFNDWPGGTRPEPRRSSGRTSIAPE